MTILKRGLFGYTRKSVHEYFNPLEDEIRQLKTEKLAKQTKIQELTAILHQNESEEDLIREAIIDAQHLSRRLVREAKEKAAEIIFDAEQEIVRRQAEFDDSMLSLSQLKTELENQNSNLEKEFQSLLDSYRHSIEIADTSSFNSLNQTVSQGLEEADQVIKTSSKVIFMTAEEREQAQYSSLTLLTPTPSNETGGIPLYSFG